MSNEINGVLIQALSSDLGTAVNIEKKHTKGTVRAV